jgi:hypothetical protein
MATSVGLQVTPVSVRNNDEIASAVEAFVHSPNGGAIITGGAMLTGHRDLILKLVARYKLPAVYYDRFSVAAGGLISYGPDFADQFPAMSIAFSRARSRAISLCRRRPSTNWSREGTRAHCAAVAACQRRRGDRIAMVRFRG